MSKYQDYNPDAELLKVAKSLLATRDTEIANANWQIKYMCEEIAKALSMPIQSPADTVESVRQLRILADTKIKERRAAAP